MYNQPLFTVKEVNDEFTLNVGVNGSSAFAESKKEPQVTIINGVNNIQITAKEPLGMFKAVKYDGTYCNNTKEDLSKYVGITTVALNTGETGTVIRTGYFQDNTRTLLPDSPLFISANGIIIQTKPDYPFRRIGWAIDEHSINLDPFPIVIGDT